MINLHVVGRDECEGASEGGREGERKGCGRGRGMGTLVGILKWEGRGEKGKWLSLPDSTACMGGWEGGKEKKREGGRKGWLEGEGVMGKWGEEIKEGGN